MPTKPPSTLFDPDLAKEQVPPITEKAVPLLREVLSYGLALFARCSYRPEGDDENLVILFVYLHLLEMLDAVTILLAESAPAPAALQLRAMFEVLLTIEYLTQDKAKTRKRAFAYLYKVELERKRFYLAQDPNTSEGKAFRESISDDPYSSEWKPADSPDLAERIKAIDALLDTPDLKATAEEYHRTKKARGRKPPWYGLYDGPTNVKELAALLKRGASYEILYKEWSECSHSADAIDRILTHNSSGAAARSLRDATELNHAINFAIGFAVDAARCLICYYRSGEEPVLNRWVTNEIMPIWKALPKIEVRNSRN